MRIAIANWTSCRFGGVETYLASLVSALAARGEELALITELDVPRERGRIALPAGAPRWCAADEGVERAVRALREWRPDLIYAHGDFAATLEESLLSCAPAIYFAHSYSGACISGTKMHRAPAPTACSRALGWPCLLHYFPRRCGGLSPVTMWTEFRRQTGRLARLASYDAILVASEHMRREYLRHGISADRLHVVHLPVAAADAPATQTRGDAPARDERRRLLFVGRMDWHKGGHVLIDATPEIAAALGRSVRLTMVGEGPERAHWMRRAERVHRRNPSVSIEFAGWLSGPELTQTMAQADLLAVPSLWPEPFGLTGLEAARLGIPAIAFDTGGISQWLRDGVNGHLAPADPPTPSELARAAVMALHDRGHYRRLSEGALAAVNQFTMDSHISALLEHFSAAVERRHRAAA
jgi:glycosyltransferase involved in cell wall biosynthesis